MSSYKIDGILSKLPLLALSTCLYRRVSCLMNALEGECLRLSINVNKSFIIISVFCLRPVCSVVLECLQVYSLFYTDVVVAYLFLYPLFYMDVVAIFFFFRLTCKQAPYFFFLELWFHILLTPFPFYAIFSQYSIWPTYLPEYSMLFSLLLNTIDIDAKFRIN